MKKVNKLFALILAAALCLGLSLPAMAANSLGVTFEAKLDHETLNISDQDQTVTMTVSTNKDVDVISLQGVITHDDALTLTNISNETLGFLPAHVNLGAKMFAWYDPGVQTHTIRTIVTATFTVPANTPAGTYTVGLKDLNCVKVTGSNYGDTWEDAGSASATLTLVDPNHRESQTITAADIAMTYGDTDKKINAAAQGGAITYAVKAGSENIIDVAADGKLTAKNVGEAYVTVSAAGDAIYAPASKDVKVSVSAKPITPIVAVSAGTLTYTGKDQTPAVTVKDGNQVLTEGVDYTLSYSNNRNAGQATITTTAKEGGRYTFATVVENFTIGKATITISADNKSAYVGEQVPAPSFTVKGLFDNDKLAVQPKAEYVSTPDMSKAGTVEIKVSGAEAPAGDNYTIQYVNGLLTIMNRSIDGSGSGTGSSIYGITVGNTSNGTVTVNPKSAAKGATVTINVTPDAGYELGSLTVSDSRGNQLPLSGSGSSFTFTMPAGSAVVKATFVKRSVSFGDVSANDYFASAVAWAVEKGITDGIGNGMFGPNQPCTRGQIVTFLWRAAGSPEPKAMSSFADVSANEYYAKAVAWAVENGITTGTSATTFSPNATCTRAQAVTFLCRAVGTQGAYSGAFSDVASNMYCAGSVAWAVEKGVTDGVGGGKFAPDDFCTRGQIVTFLYRAYQGK